jgi:hypothetical protein
MSRDGGAPDQRLAAGFTIHGVRREVRSGAQRIARVPRVNERTKKFRARARRRMIESVPAFAVRASARR